MEPIWKGKQTIKTSNMCAGDKGKQTNKQTSRGGMCRGTDAGGSVELRNMWSLICNVSEYTEELRRCMEMHRRCVEFGMQGHTLTVRFNTLASRVEWGDAALCFQFYDSLPD